MDPFSATVGVASLLSFSISCAKNLRRLVHDARYAPDEILAISNEVSDINLILSDIEATNKALESSGPQMQGDLGFYKGLSEQLTAARSKFGQLEGLVADLFTILPDNSTKFQRYAWLRKKSTATALQQDLVNIKRKLGLLLNSAAASRIVRLQTSLEGLTTEIRRLPDRLTSSFESNSVISRVEDVSQWPEQLHDHSIAAHQSPQTSPSGTQGPHHSLPTPDETLSTLLQTVRQSGQFAALTFHVHRLARCEGICTCICHSRGLYQTPKIFNPLFGALFLGYAGLPIWKKACDKDSCSNQYSRTFQVSYTFPMWLVSRTVDFVAAMTYTSEPQFGLKVRNRVQISENSIFTFARNGNTQGILELFRKRRASPNDLSSRSGQSVLHFALELGQIETCRFLLKAGIDPYIIDDNGVSAAHEISTSILSKERFHQKHEYENVFSDIANAHSELWDFTFLHKAVTGILHVDLREALQSPDHLAFLNTLDSHGRSPLLWAALRGDESSVKTLLQAGADVSPLDWEKRSALQSAIVSGNVRCVELLIMAGSSIYARDIHGDTAIQMAAWANDHPPMLETLYLAGSALEDKNQSGVTALQCAVDLNHHRNVEYLLEIGANLESRDKDDDSPLFEAIRYCNIEALEVLLRHNPRFDYTNKTGQTALHIAAMEGDLRVVHLLATVRMEGIDARARDWKGRTVLESFADRVGPPDDLREALERLLINASGEGQENGDSDNDSFVDALESLSTV